MANTEHQLIDGLRNGDARSYETLVRNYGGRMLSVARRYLKIEADAQDCVQDAYIQAFRNVGKFEGRSTLETWLHRIVVNAALTKIRTLKRRPEEFIEDNISLFDKHGMRVETEAEISLSVENLLENKTKRMLVRQLIEDLPANSRNLLILRDIEGYNTQETADLLGISEGSVKTGLHRARGAFKLKLEQVMSEEET